MAIAAIVESVKRGRSPCKVRSPIPLKVVNGATVYMRNVAQVRDGFTRQTTMIRMDGQRGASTLDIVRQIKAQLPEIRASPNRG